MSKNDLIIGQLYYNEDCEKYCTFLEFDNFWDWPIFQLKGENTGYLETKWVTCIRKLTPLEKALYVRW